MIDQQQQWSKYDGTDDCLTLYYGSTFFCGGLSAIVFVITLFGLVDHYMDRIVFMRVWFITASLIVTWFVLITVYYRRHVVKWFQQNCSCGP